MKFTTILKWIFMVPIGALGLILLLICPLIVLIKGMIIAYDHEFETHWALFFGSLATFAVLLIYLLVINRIFQQRFHISHKWKLITAGVAVLAYNGHALFILSEQNVKQRNLTDQYTGLHPILRVGVRTWTVFDPDLVITDMSRNIKDYNRMRVRAYHRSLHFRQKDGYVHAVDLRTTGRSKFRNWMAEMVFRMMGFGTLRHVGTADHLHVQLGLSKKDRQPKIVKRAAIKKRTPAKTQSKTNDTQPVAATESKNPSQQPLTEDADVEIVEDAPGEKPVEQSRETTSK